MMWRISVAFENDEWLFNDLSNRVFASRGSDNSSGVSFYFSLLITFGRPFSSKN
jgi:hypothetical protein